MGTSQAPVLSEHRATLRKGTTTLESPTVQGSTDTVYTNVRDFTEIQIVTKSSYQPTHLPDLGSGHPYIDRVRLGVVSATASAVVNREFATHLFNLIVTVSFRQRLRQFVIFSIGAL